MKSFSKKTVFVTGGASGIGLAISRSFLSRGANVVIADIDVEKLDSSLRELRNLSDCVDGVMCDVSDLNSVKSAAGFVDDRFGNVHVVINNAGVSFRAVAGKTPVPDWNWIIGVNLMGVVHGVEVFLPKIRAHGEGGHIVNTASMAGHFAMPTVAAYNATKFAVVGYSETLHKELEREEIGVSILCPGFVATDIYKTQNMRPSGKQGAQFSDKQMDMVDGGLAPNAVGELVVDCVRINRLYIFTDGEMLPLLGSRKSEIETDYQACLRHPAINQTP
ncbi:MAG: short-chain dehydrogenase [Rhodospirillaceae bacterium]|nr:short-chain dehydrogenase [Rhodospirillaceae bacterium]